MALLRRRSASDRLSAAFARAIRQAASEPGPVLGLEHEYRVVTSSGRAVDFGRLVGSLALDGVRLDPADRNAIRGAWGGAITADDREAEVAVAPVMLGPGCSTTATSRAVLGRARLVASLPPGLALEGYSTHLSVEVPDRLVEVVARRYAAVFAPALALLLEGPDSPGLLIRPRPGRLELGGEFVTGDRLRAALLFAAGSALATLASLRGRPWARTELPPAVRLAIAPAIARYGWFVPRVAPGSDLYATGRATRLVLQDGRTVRAQAHLERCWAVARRALEGAVAVDELHLVDAYIRGDRALGLEVEQAQAIALDDTPAATDAAGTESPFGSAAATRTRNGLRIEPVLLSWDFVVLRVTDLATPDEPRAAYACLPRSVLGAALEALDAGHLDALLRAYLAADADRRLLASSRQTSSPGLYRAMRSGTGLLAPERGPIRGERPGKRDRREPRDEPLEGRTTAPSRDAAPVVAAAAGLTILGLPAAAAAAVVGVAAVAVVGGAILLGGAPDPTPAPASAAASDGGAPPPTAAAVATSSPTPLPSSNPPASFPVALPSLAPAPDVYTTGTASLVAGGDFSGSIVLTRINDGSTSLPTGESYPSLTWSDETTGDLLFLWFPTRHATGTFSTADGTLGVSYQLTATGPDGEQSWIGGHGLGLDPPPRPCTATVALSATGGLTGSLKCRDLNSGKDVFALDGTFTAELGVAPGT